MNSNISVSKGVFVFKNNLKELKERRGSASNANLNIYSDQLWYHTYTNLWRNIEKRIDILNKETFSSILTDIVQYIKGSYASEKTEIPAAALLTGINMPDHIAQFATLLKKIKQEVSPHIACVYSQDCQNIKSFVENTINQFINKNVPLLRDESEFETESKYKLKKSQLNFSILQAWYKNEHDVFKQIKSEKKLRKHQHKLLVVVLPDFESFNVKILQQFILICSSYINILPFVFVFGIATSLTVLHKALPYNVISKVNIQYFNSQSSTVYLNNILENVFLTNECQFHLGADVFDLLMDVFLFYDLSVTGFIKKYKYAMLEHFSYGNAMILCSKKNPAEIISKFNHEDCENVRHLLSFRKLVESESNKNKIKLLIDDDYFKTVLQEEISKIQRYLNTFHLFLKCLKILVEDLPKNPIGKQIRELYSKAVISDITQSKDFKICMQLVQMQSKEDLQGKISEIADLIKDECKPNNPNKDVLKADLKIIYEHVEEIEKSDKYVSETNILVQGIENVNINNTKNRAELRELLQKRIQQPKLSSKHEAACEKLVKFLSNLFEKYLYCPTQLYFHEIFFFNDASIENNVVGAHRAAIHTALNDPHHYLQCECCSKPNDASVLKSMPDICIIYKLHLEYGKIINLYDWLQAFVSIVTPKNADDEDEEDVREIDSMLQARFTLAVAEMEFLGFIKSSKKKTDHVQRLTWGG